MSQQAHVEKTSLGRVALTVGAAAVFAAAIFVTGCSASDSTEGTTSSSAATTATTVAAAGNSGSTTTSGPTRLVVGGKTSEEYAAQIPDLQKAVDASPSDLTALQELAVAQYNSGKYDDAAATYQKMLKIQDDPIVHNNYGNVLRDQKKLAEAKAQYQEAVAGNPSQVAPYINLAQILAAEGNLSEAQKVLDQGIARTVGEDRQRMQDYKTALSQAK
jgi:Flp pilus assembly protein TadD